MKKVLSAPLLALSFALSVAGIAREQPKLAATSHRVKLREDVFLLPPPKELRAMTFGYHAAAVDQLWAKLLVEYGVHWAERRPFTEITRFIDAIIELEPDNPTLYKYVDTLLVYHAGGPGTEEEARTARRYLEIGIRERPYDHDLWLHYGQFVAFLGPSFLASDDDRGTWRKEGSVAIGRAVELGADADRSLAAASVLSRAGERDAAVHYLERAYALTDDEGTRAKILAQLQRYQAGAISDARERDVKFVESWWRRDYPFLTRGEFLMLAPNRDAAQCAGPTSVDRSECATTWDEALEKRAMGP